jgi:hypothetical protein
VYVGSDEAASCNHTVKNNLILNTTIGPNVTAEHIDIKEGADGTLVQNCTFNGTGINGANSADSFIDIKGVNSKIYNNTGFRTAFTALAIQQARIMISAATRSISTASVISST